MSQLRKKAKYLIGVRYPKNRKIGNEVPENEMQGRHEFEAIEKQRINYWKLTATKTVSTTK